MEVEDRRMRQSWLVECRKQAEAAVQDMPDGPLQISAFETILGRLLAEKAPPAQPSNVSVSRKTEPKTLGDRIGLVRDQGFFSGQRSLAEVRASDWTLRLGSLN